MRVLKKAFYGRDSEIVARELLGKMLVRAAVGVTFKAKIVETEAYFGPGDAASHAHKGPTPRSAIMFGPPGRAYIYLNYGVHYLLNFVTEEDGKAGAVLIRAVEPVEGVEAMARNRGSAMFDAVAATTGGGLGSWASDDLRNLTNGPGKLTKAMAIDISLNGLDLTKVGELYVADAPILSLNGVGQGPRVGITRGTEHHLRFFIKDNKFVSK